MKNEKLVVDDSDFFLSPLLLFHMHFVVSGINRKARHCWTLPGVFSPEHTEGIYFSGVSPTEKYLFI